MKAAFYQRWPGGDRLGPEGCGRSHGQLPGRRIR